MFACYCVLGFDLFYWVCERFAFRCLVLLDLAGFVVVCVFSLIVLLVCVGCGAGLVLVYLGVG